jgi:hypothetical protein
LRSAAAPVRGVDVPPLSELLSGFVKASVKI